MKINIDKKEIDVEFYCSQCYRTFKSLNHFNRYVNLRNGFCSPYLRTALLHDAKRLQVRKSDVTGRWMLTER